MLEWYSTELDRDIRAYAKYLSPDDGEDGYHDAVVSYLERPLAIIKPTAWWRHAIKMCVFKIWRHEGSEREMVTAYLRGDGSPYLPNLKAGRLPHTHCRRGHLFTPESIYFVGTQRTCKICERLRRAAKKKGESL